MYYAFIAYNHKNKLFAIGVTIDLKRRLKNMNATRKNDEQIKIVHYEYYDSSHLASLTEDMWIAMSDKELNEMVLSTNPILIDLSAKL